MAAEATATATVAVTATATATAIATSMARNGARVRAQPQKREHNRRHMHLQRHQQQQPQHHKYERPQSESQSQSQLASQLSQLLQLHFKLKVLQMQQIAMAAVAFGLLSAIICVSGQIDGYTAGLDYPAYEAVPKGLSFNCQGRLPGYYADTETRCQVWHWCLHSGHQYSFLCPNGTVFNQAVRVCDWWSNVNCPSAERLYENNVELYRANEPPNQDENLDI